MFDEYYSPSTLTECLELKARLKGNACFLGGGTDLVPRMRSRRLRPKAVIDLAGVAGLDVLENSGHEIRLGSMLRLKDLSMRACELGKYGVIARAASHVSSIQVRNMATLGGNTCNASPSADTVPALLVCNAEVELKNIESSRRMLLRDFFLTPGKTALADDEILSAFIIPDAGGRVGADYQKYAIRGDSDIAIAGSGALICLDENGRITDARIALGAVGPIPLCADEIGTFLKGKKPDKALFEQAAEMAVQTARPISDQRAGKEYRLDIVRVITRIALENAWKEAAGEE